MTKGEQTKETFLVAGGAVLGSGLTGYVESEFLSDVGMVQNVPEIVPAGTVVTGIGLRLADFTPKEMDQVLEGVAVAGAVGVIDRLMNRFKINLF